MLELLPLQCELETKEMMRLVIAARSALAELNGFASNAIPNREILINTLALQEAKDSSEIENIITTHDELFRSSIYDKNFVNQASKEVFNYRQALIYGYEKILKTSLITQNLIIEIQAILESNQAGYRKLPGTTLKSDASGEIIYTPPQNPNDITHYMNNLEQFMNDNELSDLDPLIKMAIIHHRFEAIHPFYDGNGRTGRMINVLYMIQQNLLHAPFLYLSRYINQNKPEYYRLLQHTRLHNSWGEWIIYMLTAVEKTSKLTINQIKGISDIMKNHKNIMRQELKTIYSQDLLNNLFMHPYTKIEIIMREMRVSRPTATRYLNALVDINLLEKHKIGKSYYYLNIELYDYLSQPLNFNNL